MNVTIREERRTDQDRTNFIVSWTPTRGQRCRVSRSTRDEAETEKKRIENLLRKNHNVYSPRIEKEISSALLLRDELCPAASLPEIIKSFVKSGFVQTNAISVNDAGLAFAKTRAVLDTYSERTCATVRQHIARFIKSFGPRPLSSIDSEDISAYLLDVVGGCGKTRNQHLITIRSFFRWARDRKQWLDYGRPTAPELVDAPKVSRAEHAIYTPEEFIRLLVFAPENLLTFFLLGQFAGIRTAERLRLTWSNWRTKEDNKIVLTSDITKTNQRRLVDVEPNLAKWLSRLRRGPGFPMVILSEPFRYTGRVFARAGITPKANAMRAGYASYHLALYGDAIRTAGNAGHSAEQLHKTYKAISGVTKIAAETMFNITPSVVISYALVNRLPTPEWRKMLCPMH